MDDRNVVITGVSTGIGHACALDLLAAGFKVYGTVRRPEDEKRLARAGVTPLQMDVTDAASIAAAARAVQGPLHGLVNNAGMVVSAPLETLPLDEFRRQLDVNLTGALATTQAFLPALRAGHGRLVNISSTSGRATFPMLGAYNASKFALEAISDVLRLELRPWGIHVSVVEPGPIESSIWERSADRAARIHDSLPDAAQHLYAPLYEAMRREAKRSAAAALPASAVARRVRHALSARRPRTR